jgi:hypothetical protein
MSDDTTKHRSDADAELEREIRKGRKFTLAEAVGRMAGAGAMKGASPVAREQQAAAEIETWLTEHVSACEGELGVVLLRQIVGSELFLQGFDRPLAALAAYCRLILDSDCRLKELVRQVDAEWGRVQGERPYFDKEDSPPDPDDPYTFESVRKTLAGIVEKLAGEGPLPGA